jgi:hypothetical protein
MMGTGYQQYVLGSCWNILTIPPLYLPLQEASSFSDQ